MSARNQTRIYGTDGINRSPAALTYRTVLEGGLWSDFDAATISISKFSDMPWRTTDTVGLEYVTWDDLDNLDTSGITDALTLYNINVCLDWAKKFGYTPA